MFDEIYKAINISLKFRGLQENNSLTPESLIGNYLDSMGKLEVLLILENNGYNINFINVAEISSIKDLAEKLRK